MNALLYMRLKEHLGAALAPLKLLGQSANGDRETAPQVFIGDVPAKRQNTPGRPVREIPCVIIVPMGGSLMVEDGAAEAIADVGLACTIYNPEGADQEEPETELAALVSAVTGALLPCAQGVPLDKRFVLVPDDKGKLLAWARAEHDPVPFYGATVSSRWWFKGWE